MTRGGLPTARVWKSVLQPVLGADWDSSLSYRNKDKMVSDAVQDRLAELVSEHADDLQRIADVLTVFLGVVDQLTADSRPNPALRGMRVDWAPIVVDLWRDGAATEHDVSQRVAVELVGAVPILRELLEDPEAEARFQNLLARLWRPTASLPAPGTPPGGLRHDQREVPTQVWEDVVTWLDGPDIVVDRPRGGEPLILGVEDIAGWAVDLQLVTDTTRQPTVIGSGDYPRTLDRPVFRRLVQLMKSNPQLVDGGLEPTALLEREVRCAASPLGLPSTEARAVLMLGYWLVAGRSFDTSRREFQGLDPDLRSGSRRHACDDPDADSDDERNHSAPLLTYHHMYRDVWRRIRLMGGGRTVTAAVDDGIVTTTTLSRRQQEERPVDALRDTADSEGMRRLGNPERTFMNRFWSRVHTYSHRGPITAETASRLIDGVWSTWIKDVVTQMGQPPSPDDDVPPYDAPALGEVLYGVMRAAPAGAFLATVYALLAAEDLEPLRDEWAGMLDQAAVGADQRVATGIDELEVVRDYLRKHGR